MTKIRDDLDLRKLEVFYWVVELRSFSLAADHLSLRQPTVSAHIREMEERLGSKILSRVGGEVAPTALGQILFDRAKSVLTVKRETLAAVARFQNRVSGELLIGGSTIPGEYILPRKLGLFVRRYPEVKPLLRISDSAGVVQALLDGEVEVGFVGFKGNDQRLSFRKVWKDEMVLVVPKDHPWSRLKAVRPEALREQGFISREGGSGTLRSLRALMSRKGKDPEKFLHVVMELGSTQAVKEALIAGLGISVLSETSVQREIHDGLLKKLDIRGLKLQRDFYEVVHRTRVLSSASEAFRNFIREN